MRDLVARAAQSWWGSSLQFGWSLGQLPQPQDPKSDGNMFDAHRQGCVDRSGEQYRHGKVTELLMEVKGFPTVE